MSTRDAARAGTLPDADRRWSIARDLLHGPGHEAVDRVAGCLVLLYAQPLTRIAVLTLAHVSDAPAGLSLSLGSDPVDIPEPLADLLRELIARRRGHTSIGRAEDSTWLFPGGQPGRPISPQRLGERLTRLGIPARAGCSRQHRRRIRRPGCPPLSLSRPGPRTTRVTSQLSAALRAAAAGIHPDEAGAGLIISHGAFLRRADFTCHIERAACISDGTPMPWIDWDAVITALDSGHLPASGGEKRIIRIAASLAAGHPVSLRDAVPRLDQRSLHLVTAAIRHAAGQRE